MEKCPLCGKSSGHDRLCGLPNRKNIDLDKLRTARSKSSYKGKKPFRLDRSEIENNDIDNNIDNSDT
jgi:hypothetical protein